MDFDKEEARIERVFLPIVIAFGVAALALVGVSCWAIVAVVSHFVH